LRIALEAQNPIPRIRIQIEISGHFSPISISLAEVMRILQRSYEINPHDEGLKGVGQEGVHNGSAWPSVPPGYYCTRAPLGKSVYLQGFVTRFTSQQSNSTIFMAAKLIPHPCHVFQQKMNEV